MLRGIPFPSVYGSSSTLCRRSLLQSFAGRRQQTRCISLKVLARREEAARRWDERAELIREGKLPHLWDTFKERGYVKDIAGTDEQISELMRRERIGAYVGIDPTAASLHIGHLLPLMPLFWMYINGYKVISLIGGATAKIGDPTGRLKSRGNMSSADISRNITKAHYQLKRLWINLETMAARHGYEKENKVWSRALYNNSIWYSSLPFTEITGRLFRKVRLSTLLSRETVKNKMEKGEGMSLDELLYPLLQAWDFWMLFKRNGVRMQIGGSDQYGNIVSGVESLKYIRDSYSNTPEAFPDDLLNNPVGFTTPLLTDSAGNKFGKSAGNAIWLDPFMTSPFDLYGYWMRRPDDDVERLLKLFTFLPLEEITKIVEKHKEDPPKRHAQHILAFEVVALVHSMKEAQNTQDRHKGLFSKGDTVVTQYPSKNTPAVSSLAAAFQIDIKLPRSLILGKSISRILFAAGLAESTSDAHRLTKHQGAYVGGAPGTNPNPYNRVMRDGDLAFTPVKNWFTEDTQNYLIDKKMLILRRGKHFVRVIEMVSDEEWEQSGMIYPGEPGTGRVRVLRQALQKAAESEGLTDDPDTKSEVLNRMEELYSDNSKMWSDGKETPGPNIPQNRAKQILQQALRPFLRRGPPSARSKTEAIDEVLARTHKELEKYKFAGRKLPWEETESRERDPEE
ncbi:uncharacterized protein GGS22DRAFT_172880 [Annulohypoxylon maeteangense]|uniref:uncharacterized protein n=1 Tax=Annulohypoxylon maeteangense TaxID=1927788 RepID=UPI002008050D|nr:uncharacterized protein GGS22DRAFT_172880 [Annulohypoxylon maeteangense]KAI0881301.1 hypothetical protein GGS22DRAFT_172880 [Annulohypoxylon maeteangense]